MSSSLRPVFVVDAVRTPIGRYGGGLATVRPDDLAAHVIEALVRRQPGLAGEIDHVVFGATNQAGEDNRNVARMAALLAGLPYEVPAVTVNRLCGSGLEAVADAARRIATGECECVIAGGVESMTRAPFSMPKSRVGVRSQAAAGLRHDARLALPEPANASALFARLDGRDGRERRREVRRSRARSRTPSRSSRTSARPPRRGQARSTPRSSR